MRIPAICYLAATLVLFITPLQAEDLATPNEFTSGATASASDVNANFNAVETAVNSKQNLITGTCPVGSAIREVNNDGSVLCETDDDSAIVTAVNTKQNTITGTCPAGSAINTVNTDGSVVCEISNDSGLQAAVNAKQNIVTEICAPGSSIREIRSNGTVACEFDDDTGVADITAGTNLMNSGTLTSPVLNVMNVPAFAVSKTTTNSNIGDAYSNVRQLVFRPPTTGIAVVTVNGAAACFENDGYGGANIRAISAQLINQTSGEAGPVVQLSGATLNNSWQAARFSTSFVFDIDSVSDQTVFLQVRCARPGFDNPLRTIQVQGILAEFYSQDITITP